MMGISSCGYIRKKTALVNRLLHIPSELSSTYLSISIDCRDDDLPQGVYLDLIRALLQCRAKLLRGWAFRAIFVNYGVACRVLRGHPFGLRVGLPQRPRVQKIYEGGGRELWIYDVGGARLPRSHFRHLPSPPMIPAASGIWSAPSLIQI